MNRWILTSGLFLGFAIWLGADVHAQPPFLRQGGSAERLGSLLDAINGPIIGRTSAEAQPLHRLPVPIAPQVAVRFLSPFEAEIISTFDVSNVAVLFEDGSSDRYEGLSGRRLVFRSMGVHAGKPIHSLWVKAGPNLSGDGPGLGQRFERISPAVEPNPLEAPRSPHRGRR